MGGRAAGGGVITGGARSEKKTAATSLYALQGASATESRGLTASAVCSRSPAAPAPHNPKTARPSVIPRPRNGLVEDDPEDLDVVGWAMLIPDGYTA